MKKILISIIMLGLAFTVTACNSKNKKQEETPVQDNTELTEIEKQVKNETKETQEEITFSDIKIREYGASNIVSGKLKNNRKETRNIELTLKMYNSTTSRVLGRVTTEIKDLKAGEERNFEISIMGDYRAVDRFEVEVKDI